MQRNHPGARLSQGQLASFFLPVCRRDCRMDGGNVCGNIFTCYFSWRVISAFLLNNFFFCDMIY